MKQLSSRNLTLITLVVIAVLAVGVLAFQNRVQEPQEIVEVSKSEESQENKNDNDQKFVTDVDMNIDNWQTKETEFFTIEYPKEWYFLESRVITNNPNLNINKYSDIGLFSGGDYPMVLGSDAEFFIAFNGFPTSNSGTPKDSMNYIRDSVLETDSSADCKKIQVENTSVSLLVACHLTDREGYAIRKYGVINERVSITMTVGMTKNTIANTEIFDKIAQSIVLKSGHSE
jgi:hypothetical protein